jgi:5S rRNA maturation endonuclease (ribonuclease M5)
MSNTTGKTPERQDETARPRPDLSRSSMVEPCARAMDSLIREQREQIVHLGTCFGIANENYRQWTESRKFEGVDENGAEAILHVRLPMKLWLERHSSMWPYGDDFDAPARNSDGYPFGEARGGAVVDEYIYEDEHGEPYSRVERTESKQFPQSKWVVVAKHGIQSGHWEYGKPDGPKIPYLLPSLIKTPLDQPILICEGEGKTNAVFELGLAATCASEGAGKWTDDLNKWFEKRQTVYVLEDNDASGRKHAAMVAKNLAPIVADVRIVRFRELVEHHDVADWIELQRATGFDNDYIKKMLLERAEAAPSCKRVQEYAPSKVAPITPVMALLDNRLLTDEDEPPMRDVNGCPVEVRDRRPISSLLHELVAEPDPDSTADEIPLPAPSLPLLTTHDETSLAILVERYVDFFVTKDQGENKPPLKISVALNSAFVKHYSRYRDSTLPVVHAVATMPLILPSGRLLTADGLDREHGIVFRIDPALAALIPKPSDIMKEDIQRAMKFLLDDWLVDVSADFEGKCVLLALALSIIERAVLPERPVYFATAPKRAGGKTYALNMISLATTGRKAPAAAWSGSEEERRKVMLPILADGIPVFVWDNIEVGSALSSPTIEKVCTSSTYQDRILGVSKILTVPTSTIMAFTGNNIAPKGDLASRTLETRISVDRPDPENREFKHPFAFDWTLARRGAILEALYTVLLSNPQLGQALPKDRDTTRFKPWWMLIGSALEHAAEQYGRTLAFGSLFAAVEADDTDAAGNVEVLEALYVEYCGEWFRAAKVLECVTQSIPDDAPPEMRMRRRTLANYFVQDGRSVSNEGVSRKLKALVDAPYLLPDNGKIKLVRERDNHAKSYRFKIERSI